MYKPTPIEVAIEIPSGQIVFADDLRFAYPVPEEKGSPQTAGGPLWQKIITEAYGEVGLFHGYVGNSCPSINKHNGMLIIGNPSYDSEEWESRDDLPGKQVGSVCTDLWWYSIADKEDLFERIHAAGNDPEGFRFDGTLEVEPGRYVLKHYYPHFGKSRTKHGESEVYATLQRSDKEIKPHKLPDEGVVEMLMKHPDLSYACVQYDKDKIDEIDKNGALVFEYYQILMHWEVPEAGSVFATPKFTGEELQNHGLVRRRSIQCRTEGIEKAIKHEECMRIIKEKIDKMSPEEKAAHDKKLTEVLEELKNDYK